MSFTRKNKQFSNLWLLYIPLGCVRSCSKL